jgi:hypothetical protein
MGPALSTFGDLRNNESCTCRNSINIFESFGHERLNVSQPAAHRSEHDHANPKRRKISLARYLLVGS